MKHVRKSHPHRPARIIKINPKNADSQLHFGGRLVINGAPLLLKEVNQEDMPPIEGAVYDDAASVTSDTQKSDASDKTIETASQDGSEPAKKAKIRLNCHVCSFNTGDENVFISHLTTHQSEQTIHVDDGDMSSQLSSIPGESDSRESSPQPPRLTQAEALELVNRKTLKVRLYNIVTGSQASLDALLAKHDVTTISFPPEFFAKFSMTQSGS